MTDTSASTRRSTKLQLGKIQSDNLERITLGLTEGGGRLVQADVPTGANILAVGHGVPHTARFFETVIAHYRAFKVPVYGIDLFPLLSDFSKQLFAGPLVFKRDAGEQLIHRLIAAGDPVVLLVARADAGLRREHHEGEVGPFQQALLDAAAAANITLIITCYESTKEADLPTALIEASQLRIGLGKLFAGEAARLLDERETGVMQAMSLKSSVLAGRGVFQHDHPTFAENFQVVTPGAARYL